MSILKVSKSIYQKAVLSLVREKLEDRGMVVGEVWFSNGNEVMADVRKPAENIEIKFKIDRECGEVMEC